MVYYMFFFSKKKKTELISQEVNMYTVLIQQ